MLPRLDGSVLAGLFLLAGTVLASLWLGRRSAGFRGWPRRLLRLGTGALLLFALAALTNVDQHATSDYFRGYEGVAVGNPYDSVQDVFVYDEQGRLVRNARLFDQNGVPIRLGWPTCVDRNGVVPPPSNVYPYCPEQAPFAPPSPSTVPPAPSPSAAPATAGPTDSATPLPGGPPTGTPEPATPTPTPVPTR